jgi:hypothetical protein
MNYKKGEKPMNNNINKIDFKSKECKKEKHKSCDRTWNGLGFTVICTCNCHIELDEKNIVLDGPSKSSNTHCNKDILNLAI